MLRITYSGPSSILANRQCYHKPADWRHTLIPAILSSGSVSNIHFLCTVWPEKKRQKWQYLLRKQLRLLF